MDERRTIAVVLITSTLLTMLGIAGIFGGATQLSSRPVSAIEDTDDPKEAAEERFRREILGAPTSSPYSRPLAAANVFISGLVLIGSFMLSWRRQLAIWWIKQAVIAKVLWIAAHTLLVAAHVRESAPELLPILQEYLEVAGSDASIGDGATIESMVFVLVIVGIANAVIHIVVAWRATRPDVQEFIAKSQPRV